LVVGDTSTARRFKTKFDSNTVYSAADFETTSLQCYINNASSTIGAYTGIQFAVGNNGDAAISAIRTADGESALAFGTRGGGSRLERARIDSSGNLAIGSTYALRFNTTGSASAKLLTLYSTGTNAGTRAEFQIGSAATGSGETTGLIMFGCGASTTTANAPAIIYSELTASSTSVAYGALVFGTANGAASTERARIDSSGNLLVGTTSSGGGKVYVVGGASQSAILGTTSTLNYAGIQGAHTVNASNAYVAYFANSGSTTGLYISNTAAWQSTSDERLKTDIQDLDSTQRLMQLRPRDYLWKSQETSDDPTKRNLGFIAQEVKDIFPELVGVSPDGMFSVEYTGLIAPLVKAIQEQQALITTLTARITALEGA
jgi:hypothetical protein